MYSTQTNPKVLNSETQKILTCALTSWHQSLTWILIYGEES